MLASLESDEDDFLQFTRFSTIKIFFLSTLAIISLSVIALLNLMRHSEVLNWEGNIAIKPANFDIWINISQFLILLSLLFFIINVTIGILESEHQVIVFSSVGIVVCTGIILYLNQGIYLFLFQERSSSSFYVISRSDVNWFFLTIFFAELVYLLPNIFKLIIFVKRYRKYIF